MLEGDIIDSIKLTAVDRLKFAFVICPRKSHRSTLWDFCT